VLVVVAEQSLSPSLSLSHAAELVAVLLLVVGLALVELVAGAPFGGIARTEPITSLVVGEIPFAAAS
jgi:hypothetical protein